MKISLTTIIMITIMLLMVLVAVMISNHKSKIPISKGEIEFDISGNPIYQGPVSEECNNICETYFRETGIINISK